MAESQQPPISSVSWDGTGPAFSYLHEDVVLPYSITESSVWTLKQTIVIELALQGYDI